MTHASCPQFDGNLQLVHWIYWISGSCVYGRIHAISWVCGVISFCAWLGAQLPQVVENYINQSVEGLSFGFLLNWFIGDATNFIGCILTHQLPFQTVLAFYYVCIDLVLGMQYIYYSRRKRRVIHLTDDDEIDHELCSDGRSAGEDNSGNYGNKNRFTVTTMSSFSPSRSSTSSPAPLSESTEPAHSEAVPIPNAPQRSGRTGFHLGTLVTSSFLASFTRVNSFPIYDTQALDQLQQEQTSPLSQIPSSPASLTSSQLSVGTVFAWICAFMYLTSRIPQIAKNFRRKSTWGTTMILFSSALTGNVCYTLSILLSPEARGPMRQLFLKNELPYLVGSAGTVCFDVIILCQRLYYGKKEPPHLYQVPSMVDYNENSITAQAAESYGGIEGLRQVPQARIPICNSNNLNGNADVNDITPLSLSLQSNYSE